MPRAYNRPAARSQACAVGSGGSTWLYRARLVAPMAIFERSASRILPEPIQRGSYRSQYPNAIVALVGEIDFSE
jgi:hypothetical protein